MKLKFNKKSHTYSVNGETYRGVTTLVSSFFPKFEGKEIAKKLASFPVNKANKRGVRYWLKKWKLQQEYGSLIHNLIEMHIKANLTLHDTELPKDEYISACNFLDKEVKKYVEPLLYPELKVVNHTYKIAGTIDLMIEHRKGNERVVDLIDWKVTKEITKVNKYDKSINDLGFPNANYWKYALQLNMYAWILTQEGYKINKLKLVHLNGTDLTVYEIPAMFDKIQEIIGEK